MSLTLGWNSTDLPQNLGLGYTDPWKTKSGGPESLPADDPSSDVSVLRLSA